MRPLHLSMRAFGPYADLVELDFRELEGRSLFLIHGPTGAGKTTILDAICFALFGEAAGSDRQGKSLRSQFADATVLTEVRLEFALGAAHWRVTRIAEQTRPGGVTMRPPQATLERLADDGSAELRASKVRDVDAEVAGLLGFAAEQFRQVVLLPQGEFRRLLVSDSKDREKILETLFGAELYRCIEAELKKAGAALEAEVLEGRTRIDALLRGAGAADADELEARAADEDSRRTVLEAATAELRGADDAATATLAAAEKIAALFAEKAAATVALARLDDEAPSWKTRREELAAARRAQALEAPAERVAIARTTLERETAKQERAAKDLAGANAEASAAALGLEAEQGLEAERQAAEERRRVLSTAGEAASRLAALHRAIAEAETRFADATGAIGLNGRDLAYAQGRVDAADAEISALRPLVAELDRRRGRVTEAQQTRVAVDELAAARSFLLRQSVETGGARQRIAEADAAVANAIAVEAELLRRWSEGQAALLAQRLLGGEPCPVCGSADHPHPARSTEAVPSEADVEAARAAIAKARALLDGRRGELEKEAAKEEGLRSNVALREASLGDGAELSVQDAAAAFAQAQAELVEAGKAHARAFDLEEEKKKHLAAIAVAEADQAAARERAAEEEKILARDRALAGEVGKAIPAGVETGDVPVLLDAATKLATRLAKAFDDAKSRDAAARAAAGAAAASSAQAAAARKDADVALDHAALALESALVDAGFADLRQFSASRRSAAEVDALDGGLRRFDQALATAHERAARAEEAIAGVEPPDLAASRAAASAARVALEEALAEHGRLVEASMATRRTLAAIADSAVRIEEADRRYRAVGRVAAVSAGDNAEKISFVRFVLGSFLDDVLAAATERLLRMSQGRFELLRAGGRRDRRRSGGLDLEVFDAHTGVARAVATLSGGESFLASLSLALGLADVVQSHTGGIRLETMFVDEGFGTLDPEALDLAMRALEDLQAGGRLVGIISHVAELKERVGARLEVVPGRRGSTARFAT